MATNTPRAVPWQQVNVGSERALVHRAPDGVTFLFGLGPPRGGETLDERRRELRRVLGGAVGRLCWCRQVHGVDVRTVEEAATREAMGPCDGLLTRAHQVGLVVQTADCVPMLAAGRRLVAAVHAGWRGAAGGIVHSLVETCRRAHHEEPETLRVFLGPAICADHYPVGPEVIAALTAQGVDPARWRRGDHVDLRAFLSAQLHSVGVAEVATVGDCTTCSPALASYRRDGAAAGRQLSLIYRVPGPGEEPSGEGGEGCPPLS